MNKLLLFVPLKVCDFALTNGCNFRRDNIKGTPHAEPALLILHVCSPNGQTIASTLLIHPTEQSRKSYLRKCISLLLAAV